MGFVNVTISGNAKASLAELRRRMGGVMLHQAIGGSVTALVQQHLRGRDLVPNKNRFPKTHFFAQAARGTNFKAFDDHAEVSVTQRGFAQRYYGGVISRQGPALTIPIHPAAYGHRAREFNLSWVPSGPSASPNVVGYLVRNRKGKSVGEFYYVLLNRVVQQGDPSVIPTEDAMIDAGTQGVLDQLDATTP